MAWGAMDRSTLKLAAMVALGFAIGGGVVGGLFVFWHQSALTDARNGPAPAADGASAPARTSEVSGVPQPLAYAPPRVAPGEPVQAPPSQPSVHPQAQLGSVPAEPAAAAVPAPPPNDRATAQEEPPIGAGAGNGAPSGASAPAGAARPTLLSPAAPLPPEPPQMGEARQDIPTAAKGAPAVAPAQPSPGAEMRCRAWNEVQDRDGDFRSNQAALSAPELCIDYKVIKIDGLDWRLQIVTNTRNPGTALWFVPHDNEDAAFTTAVRGVAAYGGVMVAVETGGSRYNGAQDPNRNFHPGGSYPACPQQRVRSSKFAEEILSYLPKDALGRRADRIIALHTNARGFDGDQAGGSGGISIRHPLLGSRPYRSDNPTSASSPDDTMVFLASTRALEKDPKLARLKEYLNSRGVNIMFESVQGSRNDCSLSNYAALTGMDDYVNVEVVQGDSKTQFKIVGIIMDAWGVPRLAEASPVPDGPKSSTAPGPGASGTDAAPPSAPAPAVLTGDQTPAPGPSEPAPRRAANPGEAAKTKPATKPATKPDPKLPGKPAGAAIPVPPPPPAPQ